MKDVFKVVRSADSDDVLRFVNGQISEVETLTAATKSLEDMDSGKTFVLDSTSAMTITLPDTTKSPVGVYYDFYVKTSNDNAYTIVCFDAEDSGDDFIGSLTLVAAQASDTSSGANGRVVVPASNDNRIVLDGNLANAGGDAGSYLRCMLIAQNVWFISGIIITDDADSTGAALLTT
tara:strand:- start:52 stop:582 length:531 start_codon:yes stop_codon:yes gene_type:complete